METPPQYTADHACADCGKGIAGHQARLSEDSHRSVEGIGCEPVPRCGRCLDRFRRESN